MFTLLTSYVCVLPAYSQITETYCTNVAVVIPAGGGTFTSELNVPEAGEITNVVVKLVIETGLRNNLNASLTSPPELVSVDLFSLVGGVGNDFGGFESCPTPDFILDDAAAMPVTNFIAASPPEGTYRPEEPLSLLNGENQSGIWTLSIGARATTGSSSLNCWCVEITRIEPPPVAAVPTLSEWGLVAMASILGIVGFMVIRRRKVTA